MVSAFQRAKQRVILFFRPAGESVREIVSQIPGVDVAGPRIRPGAGAVPGFTPGPGRRGGRGIAPTPTPSGETESQRQTRLAQEESIRQAELERQKALEQAATERRQATLEFQSRELQREKPTFIERVKDVSGLIFRKPDISLGFAPEVETAFKGVVELGKISGRKDIELRNKLIAKINAGEELTNLETRQAMEFGIIPSRIGERLPFGLQPIRAGDTRFQITKSLVIEPIEDIVGKKLPERIDLKVPFTDFKISINPREQVDFIVKASIFSVLMKTATTKRGEARAKGKSQQQQLKEFVDKTKKQLGKKELEKLTAQGESLVGKVEQAFIKGGKEGAEEFITKNLLSRATTDAQRQGLFNLMRSLQEKGIIRSFIFNTETGQIQFGDISTLQTGTTPLLRAEILAQVPPQLEQIAPVISGAKFVGGVRITPQQAEKQRQDFLKKQKEKSEQAVAQFDKQVQKFTQSQREKQKQLEKQIQVPRLKQPQRLAQPQPQAQITEQMLRQIPKQIQPPRQAQPQIPRQPQKVKPKIKLIPIPLLIPEFDKKPLAIAKQPGFWPKAQPINTKKFVKLTKVPVTQQQAEDIAAFLVDNSLSTNWRIEKANRFAKQPKIDIPTGYFDNTRFKWRDFKIRKGEKIPTPNSYIERKGLPRLDTFAEINNIQLLRALKQLQTTSSVRRKQVKKLRGEKRKVITLKDLQKQQPQQQQQIKEEDLFAPIEFPSVF